MGNRHVALITLHADPSTASGTRDGGGTHSYIRELMIALPKNHWNVTVLTRWADAKLPEFEIISPNVNIIRLRIGEVGMLDKRLLDDLHLDSLTAAQAALKEGRALDLIHSVYWNSGRVAMDLSERLGVPFVHTVISNGWRRLFHGADDQPANRLRIEKEVFLSAFRVFCVSGEERDDLIHHYVVNPDNAIVVGRPVAFSFLNPNHDEMGKPLPPLETLP